MMKTKSEVEAQLKSKRAQLKVVHKRFVEYDNIDDYNDLPVIEGQIEMLNWVLEKEK